MKVGKRAKIRNRYNQAPHLTQDTNGKATTSQLDITNESKEVSPFPAGDQKAPKKKHAQKSITKTRQKQHKWYTNETHLPKKPCIKFQHHHAHVSKVPSMALLGSTAADAF